MNADATCKQKMSTMQTESHHVSDAAWVQDMIVTKQPRQIKLSRDDIFTYHTTKRNTDY